MKLGLNGKILILTSISMLLLLTITLSASLHFSGEGQQHQLDETIELLETQRAQQQQLLQHSLQQKVESLSTLLTMIAPEAIFSFNFEALQAYADAAVRDEEIARVRFIDASSQALADSDPSQNAPDSFDIDQELMQDGELLGRVQIVVNHGIIKAAQQQTAEKNEQYQLEIRKDAASSRSNTLYWSILLGLITLFVVSLLSILFIRGTITNPLQQVITLFHKIGDGQYDNQIDSQRNDEIGELFHDLDQMQSQLANNIHALRENEQRALRIQVALDNVSGNIMVADNEYNIIYMNRGLQTFFRERETQIAEEIPGFEADSLMHGSIHRFHKHPERISRILDNLDSTLSGQVSISGLTFTQTINPVINDAGERLGFAVEWGDQTDQLEAEHAVAQLIHDAENGRLDRRLNADHYQGFMKTLSEGINTVLDAIHLPIQEIIKSLAALSEGDLTQRMSGNYAGEFSQLKSSYNESLNKLQQMVQEIRNIAGSISIASREISEGTNDLSNRTNARAASLEQTTSSMEEMTTLVQTNANHANEADTISADTNQLASQGSEVVMQAIGSMERINHASDRIANIISTIDDIAFQTNLLALNAAVEAARAGDQGRGFAVVAGEVRSLAQKATQEAQNIKSLVEETTDSITEGSSLVNRSGEALQAIASSVEEVSSVVRQISVASQEQSDGISQVNRAVNQLDIANQQNAALVEETAASSKALDDQAREMLSMVETFNTGT